MSAAANEVPDLLPIRMLNEFVYCPRLFYLEWVDKQWAHNEFTVDGTWQHRNVDRSKGNASAVKVDTDDPLEPDSGVSRATSVELSSTRLGLIGKIDMLETHQGSVVPVDTKRGKPVDLDHPVRLPERVQVAAQVLLLQANGYKCDHGAVFFAGARRRTTVELSPELEATTRTAIAEARRVASHHQAPPPLVDSPKCDGCSLVGICLPDETAAITGSRIEPPRRLVAADSPARPMYVTTPGLTVGRTGRRLIVRKKRDEVASARLVDVSQLCLFGNVQVSTQLVHLLMDSDVDIYWFSRAGWLKGVTSGLPSKNVELRTQQVLSSRDPTAAVAIARQMVMAKIRNQRTMLRRNGTGVAADSLSSMLRLSRRAERVTSVTSLLGLEGSAARIYFQNFSRLLKSNDLTELQGFDIKGRNRRPPTDPTNALLSFGYALLTKDCVGAAMCVGFDPYTGFLHRPRFGRPALALDLAEEFRPLIVDSVVVTTINGGMIRPQDFIVRNGGVALSDKGRRRFLDAYERRMDATIKHPVFGYPVTYRRAIELQARLLGSVILGEADTYTAFRTR